MSDIQNLSWQFELSTIPQIKICHMILTLLTKRQNDFQMTFQNMS